MNSFFSSSSPNRKKSYQDLLNDNEGLTEERNFFQQKYLEQVSELAALRKELQRNKKELQRLRNHVMMSSPTKSPPKSTPVRKGRRSTSEEKKDEDTSEEEGTEGDATVTSPDSSSLIQNDNADNDPVATTDENGEDIISPLTTFADDLAIAESGSSIISEDEDETIAIRESATRLLQWASYRQEETHTASAIDTTATPATTTPAKTTTGSSSDLPVVASEDV